MKHKVYYGEYTLEHWIDLMLSGNITLPDYQRRFVWSKDRVQRLMDSLKDDYFVPPITIGVFKIDGQIKNLILDGQQRLSSLLLAYVQRFPKKQEEGVSVAEEADENEEEQEDLEPILDWRFPKLLDVGHDRDTIMANTSEALYEVVDYGCSHSFFKKKKLGFSYIIPNTTNDAEQLKFYSTVFRNINIQGVNLMKAESRKSLYFLDNSLEGYFNPQLGDYHIRLASSIAQMDFLRYIALLADYHHSGRETSVAATYKSRMEDYYESYIYAVVNNDNSFIFGLFTDLFPEKNYKPDIARLQQHLSSLDIPHEFISIIDMDVYMFGLIYTVLFSKRNIDTGRIIHLKRDLLIAVNHFKRDQAHKKSPSGLTHLRARIKRSIAIYSRYAI